MQAVASYHGGERLIAPTRGLGGADVAFFAQGVVRGDDLFRVRFVFAFPCRVCFKRLAGQIL